MFTLGVHLIGGHDLSVCVIDRQGKIIFCTEEERYSKRKGGQYVLLPELVLNILKEERISPSEISSIAIAENLDKWKNVAHSSLLFDPAQRFKHLQLWLNILVNKIDFKGEISFVGHHLSHASSSYYLSGFNRGAILTVDGFGDGETVTIYKAEGSDLRNIYTNIFPHSIAYLYESFAYMLQLTGVERSGKLMGLSAYGKPVYKDIIFDLFISYEYDKLRLSETLTKGGTKFKIWASKIQEQLAKQGIDVLKQRENIAASIQAVFEIEIERLILLAKDLSNENNLCCSGGAFLNCLNNGKITEYPYFKNYYLSPIASDLGLSLGAALYCNRKTKYKLENLFLGTRIRDEIDAQIQERPNGPKLNFNKSKNDTALVKSACNILFNEGVIGWCQGKMEYGHRSLGNRSILANPLIENIKDKLNKLKGRELWRPFGVVVLEEEVGNWFNWTGSAPYMNIAVKASKENNLTSIQHIDGTCRIQTVSESDNKLLYDLLKRFHSEGGIPLLINTSLNIQNEPIARTADDCLRFFDNSDIEACFIGRYMIRKHSRSGHHNNPQLSMSEFPYDSEKAYLVFNPLKASALFSHRQNNVIHYSGLEGLGYLEYNTSILQVMQLMKDYQKLEIIVPWHVEVLIDMLPMVGNFILQLLRAKGQTKVNVKDIFGKELEVKEVRFTEIKPPNTDVEIHFLNSLFNNDKEKIANISYDYRIQASTFH